MVSRPNSRDWTRAWRGRRSCVSAGGVVLALSRVGLPACGAPQLLAEHAGIWSSQPGARARREDVALGAVTAHDSWTENPWRPAELSPPAAPPEGNEGIEWQQAVASTRRMQAMTSRRGAAREQSGTHYEMTSPNWRNRSAAVSGLARERGVNFTAVRRDDANLPNRVANLVTPSW
jgi:hypothetical protein